MIFFWVIPCDGKSSKGKKGDFVLNIDSFVLRVFFLFRVFVCWTKETLGVFPFIFDLEVQFLCRYLNQCATCLYMCDRLLKLMAPSRKSRSVNKRFSSANEASSSKYVEDAGKSKQKVCVFVVEDEFSKICSVCRLSICFNMKNIMFLCFNLEFGLLFWSCYRLSWSKLESVCLSIIMVFHMLKVKCLNHDRRSTITLVWLVCPCPCLTMC